MTKQDSTEDIKQDNVQKQYKPKPLITMPRLFFSFLVVSSPFVGFSYLKGYLGAVGFYNLNLNINTQESIFQLVLALQDTLIALINGQLFDKITKDAIQLGINGACIVTVVFLIARYIYHLPTSDLEQEKTGVNDKIIAFFKWFIEKPRAVLKTILVALTGFFSVFSIFYLMIVFFVGCLVFIYILMIGGYQIGKKSGMNRINKDICTIEKLDNNESVRMGCNIIYLSKPHNKDIELTGARVFESPDTIYFLTNSGAYEINKASRTVESFTPKFTKQEEQHTK